MTQRAATPFAFPALLVGALAIASSGLFVRWSETGPTATAFWRVALALPVLATWVAIETRARRSSAHSGVAAAPARATAGRRALVWAGVFFAGDLLFWHWSLLETSVAASTLEANLAPLFVTLFVWLVRGERPSRSFSAALGLALAGVILIVLPKLGGAEQSLRGDALGVITALFYAGYLLVIANARESRGAGSVMFWTSLVVAVLLLPIALTQKFLPDTWSGWGTLVGVALICQCFGQGLIAYSLAHLPASFGSVGLYLQPVAAACYAWWWLGETLAPIQIAGGATVLIAISLARVTRARD